jgi:hypothetical protein
MSGSRTLKLSILADVDDLKKKLDTGSKEVEGFGGKLEKFGKVAAVAFAAAAAAAAAYAGKLAIEGVKAAIEDEAAQLRLANALKNVTGATNDQIAAIEQQILKTSLATGVADDQLRPAYQRLAIATGDVTKSTDLLKLALDISAATGKSVEAVSNALGKAYEGNTGALGRLGVGLSTAEIKSLGLEGTMLKLADTFGGAATTQANTFEGQLARLRVGFDEAKESIGARLLPILQQTLDYVVNTAIPQFIKFKDNALKPIQDAIENNREGFEKFVAFLKNFVIPILINTFGNALETIGKVAGATITIISKVTSFISSAVGAAIDGINALIRAYNKIPLLPDISTISKPSFAQSNSTGANTVTGGSLPFGFSATSGTSTVPNVVTPTFTTSSTQSSANPNVTGTMPSFPSGLSGANLAIPTNFDVSNVRRGDAAGQPITINVNAPSAIDEEGFTRAVVLALNNSNSRTGAGAQQLVGL